MSDAADIAQDAMARAFHHWNGIVHPRAWVYRVAARELGRLFANRREEPHADPLEPNNPLLSSSAVEEWEQTSTIVSVLSILPPRQRQIMAWVLSGYTPTEISEELGMTPEAIRSSLYLARKRLAAEIKSDVDKR